LMDLISNIELNQAVESSTFSDQVWDYINCKVTNINWRSDYIIILLIAQ
jgi:hypothetical protein